MSKIFITGSEGFIGCHLLKTLVDLNYEVIAGIFYNSNLDIGNLKYWSIGKQKYNFNPVFFDIRDNNSYQQYINKVDVVIHLAGLIDVPYSYYSYNQYYETNVYGTLQLLDAILKSTSNPLLVYISSSEIYGTPDSLPISETHPYNPQSPYAASKASAELLVRSFIKSNKDMKAVIVRPFNTFGKLQSQRAIIPYLVRQFIERVPVLNIGNITTKRDFNHVSDTVNGIILAMEKYTQFDIFNIGSGNCYSIQDIISLLEKMNYYNIQLNISEDRLRPENSEVLYLQADITKANKVLGYTPKADFKTAIFKLVCQE